MRILTALALSASPALAQTTDCDLIGSNYNGFASLTLYQDAAALEVTDQSGTATPYLFHCAPDCDMAHGDYAYALTATPSFDAPTALALRATNLEGDEIFNDTFAVITCAARPSVRFD